MNITETIVMTSALPIAMVPKMMSATPMNRNQPRCALTSSIPNTGTSKAIWVSP